MIIYSTVKGCFVADLIVENESCCRFESGSEK